MTELDPMALRALAQRVSSFAETLGPREREFFGTLLALAEHAKREAENADIAAMKAEAAKKFDEAMDEANAEMFIGVVPGSTDGWPPRLKARVSKPKLHVGAGMPQDTGREPICEFLDALRSMSSPS